MKVECAVVNVITAWSVLMVNKHHWSFSQRATGYSDPFGTTVFFPFTKKITQTQQNSL